MLGPETKITPKSRFYPKFDDEKNFLSKNSNSASIFTPIYIYNKSKKQRKMARRKPKWVKLAKFHFRPEKNREKTNFSKKKIFEEKNLKKNFC